MLKRFPQKVRLIIISAGIGLLSGIVIMYAMRMGKLETMELPSVDWRFAAREIWNTRREASKDIVIVTWDDSTFLELQCRYQDWTRSFHAGVIQNLKKNEAKVIGVDIILEDPGSCGPQENTSGQTSTTAGSLDTGDQMLNQAFRTPPKNVILDSYFSLDKIKMGEVITKTTTYHLPQEIFLENGADYGFVHVHADQDTIVRQVVIAREFQDELQLSYPIKILAQYLNINEKDIQLKDNLLIFGDRKVPLETYRDEEKQLIGMMRVNFAGRPTGEVPPFQRIPYYQVYQDIAPQKLIKGKIALVGMYSHTEGRDVYPVPYSRVDRSRMFGIEILANAIHTILNNDYLRALPQKQAEWILILLGLVTGLMNYHLGFLKGLTVTAAELVGYTIIAFYFFIGRNTILPMATPAATIFLAYGGITVYRGLTEEKKAKYVRSVFTKYVAPNVVEEILSDPDKLALGGERRELTVLFSDIRGFTTMSEKLDPSEVVSYLNEYFTEMNKLVFKHSGTLDKFIGDAIMALWGVPTKHPDDPVRAVRCAVEMMEELAKLRQRWISEGKEKGATFDIGVGINTGVAVAGNIGSDLRQDYTVIGDTVNLASRLESLNKEFKSHIIISQNTYEQVKDKLPYQFRPLEPVQVKGKTEKVMIYEVLGDKTGETTKQELSVTGSA